MQCPLHVCYGALVTFKLHSQPRDQSGGCDERSESKDAHSGFKCPICKIIRRQRASLKSHSVDGNLGTMDVEREKTAERDSAKYLHSPPTPPAPGTLFYFPRIIPPVPHMRLKTLFPCNAP
ncbi:hypothetical protein GN956_G6785 [Arapaima gigas]